MEKFYFYNAEILQSGVIVHRSYGTVGETCLRNYDKNMLNALEKYVVAQAPFSVRGGSLNITALNNVE